MKTALQTGEEAPPLSMSDSSGHVLDTARVQRSLASPLMITSDTRADREATAASSMMRGSRSEVIVSHLEQRLCFHEKRARKNNMLRDFALWSGLMVCFVFLQIADRKFTLLLFLVIFFFTSLPPAVN